MTIQDKEDKFKEDYNDALLIQWNIGGSLFRILENRFGWTVKRKKDTESELT
jgi:hypothetical protein